MKKISIIIIVLSFFSNTLLGCLCHQSQSFNLETYDGSKNIAAIRIIEVIKKSKPTIDVGNWDKNYPPPPQTPEILENYAEFVIEIMEVFKGNINKSINVLRAKDKNSSCYWEPQIGAQYIFYLDDVQTEQNQTIISIFGCQRKIKTDDKNYESEKKVLKTFRDQTEGKFKIDQTKLIGVKANKYASIIGQFKHGKRHGLWQLAEPISYLGNNIQPQKNVLVLKYNNGILVSIKYNKPNNSFNENTFTLSWQYFYEAKLNSISENQ